MDSGNYQGQHYPRELADMGILAADPHDTTEDEIEDIPVPRTIVGGRIVFEA